MKTNCRNCKWAEWSTTDSGIIEYGSYTLCKFPVVAIVPASRKFLSHVISLEVTVAEYKNVGISCAGWGGIEK